MPEPVIYCSFCDKSQHEVQTVIAGPNVNICNDCVAVCNDILRHVRKPNVGPKIAAARGLRSLQVALLFRHLLSPDGRRWRRELEL